MLHNQIVDENEEKKGHPFSMHHRQFGRPTQTFEMKKILDHFFEFEKKIFCQKN